VVIKLGSAGAALGFRHGITARLPAVAVGVVDSTGAGDAFAAGFLSADLGGAGPEACLQAGVEAGARAVSRLGGQPG
jgi:sugar/nucleoside kinase (ribokinase family)